MRYCTILLFLVFLFSCAGGGVKNSTDTNADISQIKNKVSHVNVDSDVELDFKNAVVLLQESKYQQAISVLNTVVEREKRLPAPYVNLAMAYSALGEIKSAEKNLINALKLEIGHPVANNELGLLYRKAGKFKAARTAYENAIKDNPEYLPAIRNLGVLCDLYMRDYDCALQQFENYLELKPDDKTMVIWVADVKQRINK